MRNGASSIVVSASFCAALVCQASVAAAQLPRIEPRFPAHRPLPAAELAAFAQEQETRSGTEALVIEWLGATAGSAAGFALTVALTGDCDSGDDLACIITGFGFSLLTSSVGAAAGGYIAGRVADTRPSGAGVIVGSLVGAAAGVGVVHLISEDLDLTHSDFVVAASYTVTQGLFTAIGSRLFAGRPGRRGG